LPTIHARNWWATKNLQLASGLELMQSPQHVLNIIMNIFTWVIYKSSKLVLKKIKTSPIFTGEAGKIMPTSFIDLGKI
jgi:hypothetical protein